MNFRKTNDVKHSDYANYAYGSNDVDRSDYAYDAYDSNDADHSDKSCDAYYSDYTSAPGHSAAGARRWRNCESDEEQPPDAAECYLDRVLAKQRAREDKENEEPQPKRARTKRSELEKQKADLDDERRRFREYKKREHEAAMNAPRKRTPICYNETQLRKQQERLEKERAAINWKSLSSKARKRNAKKKDDDVFVVESIDALRYCRDASCDYCLDYGRWMRQWYVKWEGYGPEHSSWEHAGNLDSCVGLLTDAIFSAVGGADPESEEQCLLAFNCPEHDDDEGGEAPLQIALRDEVFPEPKRYDWMRFGGAPRPLPPAADPNDAADNRGTIYSGKKPPESLICKDGTVLEPVVVTSQVWAELQASFRRHKTKATVVREFMKLYQWHQRIQQSSGHNPNL